MAAAAEMCSGRETKKTAPKWVLQEIWVPAVFTFPPYNIIEGEKKSSTVNKGKSLLEALFFASTNPQNEDRLFIESVQYIHENSKLKPGEDMLCTEIVSDIQNIFVQNMFSPWSEKRRASDKDLPAQFDHQGSF